MNMTTAIASSAQANTSSLLATTALTTDTIDVYCRNCATRKFCEACALEQDIPSSERTKLFRPHSIQKGQYIFHAGDKLSTLYVVKSGLFKTYLNSADGDEKVVGFHMPGEILGADALAHRTHSLSAVALETSTVCASPAKTLELLVNRHSPNWLIKQVYSEVLRERHILLRTGKKYSADARIAGFLLELSASNKTRGYCKQEFKLTMPQRDIAHHLDMTLETVSRVFTRLQEQGLVEIKRPYIKIFDINKLKLLADIQPLPEQVSA